MDYFRRCLGTRRKRIGAVFSVLMLVGLATIAWREGGRAGEKMDECVAQKLGVMGEYMSDKKAAYRIAVDACARYDPDGAVKIPLDR